MLGRWGHTSAVYDSKIYVFGGRFSSDLNDIIVIDPAAHKLRNVKLAIDTKTPDPRRRHSACFIGSSMVVFGGFNGDYFNDLHYINLFETPKSWPNPAPSGFRQMLGTEFLSDMLLTTKEGELVPAHKAILAQSCRTAEDAQAYLQQIDKGCPKDELMKILESAYKPELRKVRSDEHHARLDPHPIEPAHRKPNSRPIMGQTHLEYRMKYFSNPFHDSHILFSNGHKLQVSRAILSGKSQFFYDLFSDSFADEALWIEVDSSKEVSHWEQLVMFLHYDELISPYELGAEDYLQLMELSDYTVLPKLSTLCEKRLIDIIHHKVSALRLETSRKQGVTKEIRALLEKANQLGADALVAVTAIEYIRASDEGVISAMEFRQPIESYVNHLKHTLRFDLAQRTAERAFQKPILTKSTFLEDSEKENAEPNNFSSNNY